LHGISYLVVNITVLLSRFSFEIYYNCEIIRPNTYRKEKIPPLALKITLNNLHVSTRYHRSGPKSQTPPLKSGDPNFPVPIGYRKPMPSLHIEHLANFITEVVAHFDGDFACHGSRERPAGGAGKGIKGKR
jgi:hypothetical protein